MSKSLTKKTFSGALWLGGVKASNAIFQFAILAILARWSVYICCDSFIML